MSKKTQRPSYFRTHSSITQRPDTHGPTLDLHVYGHNSDVLAKEVAETIHDRIIDRHADESLGRGAMLEAHAGEEKGNSLAPNEDMGAWLPDAEGPSRQGKRSQSERRVLPGGTVKQRGKKASA